MTLALITELEKRKKILFIAGIIIALIWGGKDSNFWGLKDKGGKQILNEVGDGLVEPRGVLLTSEQEKEITKLITETPEKYSVIQKSLISKKTGEEILEEVKSGKVDLSDLYINHRQYQELVELISKNPNAYSEDQKSLIKEKSGETILLEVGKGITKPSLVQLSPTQYEEVKMLLMSNPDKYSSTQKELIPELLTELDRISIKMEGEQKEKIVLDKTGKEILNEIGLGNYEPEEIKLTSIQYNEIKTLLLRAPNKYNRMQRRLIPALKEELFERAEESTLKVVELNMTGEEILYEIGIGNIDPKEVKLTENQLKEVKELIVNNPNDYNENQKSLVK